MSPIVLALLAFISVGAIGFAFVPGVFASGRADKRRKAVEGDYQVSRANTVQERNREDRRKTVQDALKQQAETLNKRKQKLTIQTRINQGGMKIKRNAFLRNLAILAVVIALGAFVGGAPIYLAPVFGVSLAYVGGMWFLSFRRNRYQNNFLNEFPNAIEAIIRGIKAGMPLNDSIRHVAKEVKEPVRSEFGRVLEQQSIGKSMMEAVEVLYERVPVAEVNFFVVVITVQQQAGGNLSEALSNLARVLRNRKKLKLKIKAMSSEAKASAGIIGSLPFIVGILVSFASPGYLVPLFTTPLGHVWLAVGVGMLGLGSFVMKKMVSFDY